MDLELNVYLTVIKLHKSFELILIFKKLNNDLLKSCI